MKGFSIMLSLVVVLALLTQLTPSVAVRPFKGEVVDRSLLIEVYVERTVFRLIYGVKAAEACLNQCYIDFTVPGWLKVASISAVDVGSGERLLAFIKGIPQDMGIVRVYLPALEEGAQARFAVNLTVMNQGFWEVAEGRATLTMGLASFGEGFSEVRILMAPEVAADTAATPPPSSTGGREGWVEYVYTNTSRDLQIVLTSGSPELQRKALAPPPVRHDAYYLPLAVTISAVILAAFGLTYRSYARAKSRMLSSWEYAAVMDPDNWGRVLRQMVLDSVRAGCTTIKPEGGGFEVRVARSCGEWHLNALLWSLAARHRDGAVGIVKVLSLVRGRAATIRKSGEFELLISKLNERLRPPSTDDLVAWSRWFGENLNYLILDFGVYDRMVASLPRSAYSQREWSERLTWLRPIWWAVNLVVMSGKPTPPSLAELLGSFREIVARMDKWASALIEEAIEKATLIGS